MNIKIRRRLMIFQIAFILIFSIIIIRLGYIHLYESDELKAEVQKQKILQRVIPAKRGMILDRNGAKFGISLYKYKITLDTRVITNMEYTINKISEVLLMDEKEIFETVNNSNSVAIKIRDVYDEELANELGNCFLKGVWIDKIEYRKYPNETLASQVIGFARYEDDGSTLYGEYGIEKQFNEELKGIDGLLRTEKDKWYNELVYADRFEIDARNGNNIVLTIDQVIQFYVERAIKEASKIYDPKAVHAIIMDVNNGEILAMASEPTFDSNNFSELIGITNEELENMTETEISNMYFDRWRNHIISDSYELGSTLKLVTTAIALEENFYTPNSMFDVGNKIDVADKTIKCWYYPNNHGPETLTQAVENSCNPVFVTIGQTIGKDILYDYFEDFGLTEKTGIELPAEANPQVYKREDVHEVELATMTFGHGIANTPIELISAISAIVNGGYLLEPHILKQIEDEKGNVLIESQRTVKKQVISEITSTQMRTIMQSVVENGSGHAVYTEGIPIGAKTGTSEKTVNGVYTGDAAIASFIAVAPIDKPQIAIYLFIDEPKDEIYGSIVAGPIVKTILDDVLPYMGIEKKFEVVEDIVNAPNLIGLTFKEAKIILEELNLGYMIDVTEMDDEKIVIDQYPKQGTPIKINSSMLLEFNN